MSTSEQAEEAAHLKAAPQIKLQQDSRSRKDAKSGARARRAKILPTVSGCHNSFHAH